MSSLKWLIFIGSHFVFIWENHSLIKNFSFHIIMHFSKILTSSKKNILNHSSSVHVCINIYSMDICMSKHI